MGEPDGMLPEDPLPPAQPKQLNALEEAKRVSGESPQPLNALITQVFRRIPGIRSLLGLKRARINYDPRNLYFNVPIPDEELDWKTKKPKAAYASNKVKTTKYTPINFLPKNILFQFQNVANIYFLLVAILSGFSIFGVSNAGLASVPIIAIVVVTALRDGFEDWRRQVLDLELNNTVAVVLYNVANENSPMGNVNPWRRFKKACSRFYRRTWNKMRRKPDSAQAIDVSVANDNQSVSSASMRHANSGYSGPSLHYDPHHQRSRSDNASSLHELSRARRNDTRPTFRGKFWKDVRVGDIVKVYADQGVPADIVVLSSSDPDGDCFIDTRNLDGESSLKPRRAINATKNLRRGWQINERRFKIHVEGANPDLNSFGWNFTDMETGQDEPLGTLNFLPRGSTVRNSRWVIGYVVYTGAESKIVLNAGETPTKRSRLARDLNFYVACSFIFLFFACLVSGIVEGVKFRNKRNSLYFFEEGLLTKNPALNGFVTFFAAMLVLQNLVPISLYISIEIARTCLAFFIYSDCYMYDEETDYPCTPKSWALADDLGQIEFIFSDKTGTLTQNSMIFRKCSINGKAYGTAFTESMAGQIKMRNGDVDAVRAEMTQVIEEEREKMRARLNQLYVNPYCSHLSTLVSEPIVADLQGASGEQQHSQIEQFALVLALCNTVVTDVREVQDDKVQDVHDVGNATAGMTDVNVGATPSRVSMLTTAEPNNFDLAYPNNSRTSLNNANGGGGGGAAATSANNWEKRRSAISLAASEAAVLAGENSMRRGSTDHRPSVASSRRAASVGVYGGAGRNSVGSARPKHAPDYHKMEGKELMHKAESPDESALVTMARDLGYTLVEDGKHHKVVDMQGQFHRFEILQTILFTSARKRMSVLARNESGRYFLLTKGADSIMEELLSETSRGSAVHKQTVDDLDKFGQEGLRTLMICYREIDPEYALEWSQRVTEASAQPNRDELIPALAEEVENNLELLGGTGIEDQLQEDVPNTIALLGKAGIKLWMLTGDKVETAISIGFSCNLLNTSMELLIVKHPEELAERLRDMNLEVTKETLAEAGADHRPAQGKYALVIDGSVLDVLVGNYEYRLQFALLGKKCKSVLCCRVSPSQKAAVVHIMKSTFDVTTLAIGDGANDVSMIQEADVGVGIVGVEGRQAAMSSDFAIGQFRFLQRLVLVHGRWSYQRVASMINTLLFENFMFSMTLFWYGICSQYDQSFLYDYTYLTLFNSVFVSVPVVVRGIFDQDVPDYMLLKYPQLYGSGILRKAWGKPTYFFTVADGIYQSAVAFFFAYSIFFTGKFYTLSGRDIAYRQGIGVLVGATSVFACNTYVLIGQSRWDWLSLVVYVVSCWLIFAWTGIYTAVIASNFFYRSAEIVYDQLTFWAYFLLSLATALMPRFAYTCVKRIWFPSDVDLIKEIQFKAKHIDKKPLSPYDQDNAVDTNAMVENEEEGGNTQQRGVTSTDSSETVREKPHTN